MRVRELAVAGSVLDNEWADVYAIIVQFRKIGRFTAWRAEEAKLGLILGPDAFRVPDSAGAPAPDLPVWRAIPQARQAWRRTLEARVQQELALVQALQAAVSAAEEEALPLLREACVAAIAGDRDRAVIADRLTRELGIDCSDRGHQRTTRAYQALETLQEVLLSLRTGRLKSEPPVLGTANPAAGWELALDRRRSTKVGLRRGMALDGRLRHLERRHPGLRLPGDLPGAGAAAGGSADQGVRGPDDRPAQPAAAGPAAGPRAAASYLAQLGSELGAAVPARWAQASDDHRGTHRCPAGQPAHSSTSGPHRRSPSRPRPGYVQEIFYFVPLALALQLQRSGQYLAALDWIETFYTDHFAAGSARSTTGSCWRRRSTPVPAQSGQLAARGPEPARDRHRRGNAHTRFTLMTLARLLPGLRRRRVHPRRARVAGPGPRPLPGRARPAGACRR